MNNQNKFLVNKFEARADSLKKKMVDLELADSNLIRGCSEEEISRLEKGSNVIFPVSYKVFLKTFGHSFGGLVMSDIAIRYNEIQGYGEIQDLVSYFRDEILIEDNDPVLPKKAFIFSHRYLEQFTFFDGSGLIKEPPIMYYIEYAEDFKKIGESVFNLLEMEIKTSLYYKIERDKFQKRFNK